MAVIGKKLRSLEGGRVAFFCPGCLTHHQVRVAGKGMAVWDYNQNPDAPTFRPSIFVNRPGKYHVEGAHSCHSFVTDGMIRFLNDCTHDLAGKTVELPDLYRHGQIDMGGYKEGHGDG